LLLLALLQTPALGQQVAYISKNPLSGQDLSTHALECLRRGEDAFTKENRLAAYREGLQYAERALAADDNNADAHFARFANHGRILLMEGVTPNPINLLKANHDLERALELNPNHADALAAKGGMYRQLPRLLGGSQRKAEECLGRAIAIDPDHALGARLELAQLYRDRGEPERGIPLLHKAISIAEHDGKVRQRDEAQDLLRHFTGEISTGE
jgi:tetratricopeptide (TPR) repeat protein